MYLILSLPFCVHITYIFASISKSAQSNLGKGLRHGAVAHVLCKVPIGYNGAPQKYTFPWTNPQTAVPASASSLDPSDLDAKWHRDPIHYFPQCTGQTDWRTDAQTDRSSTGKSDDYRPSDVA